MPQRAQTVAPAERSSCTPSKPDGLEVKVLRGYRPQETQAKLKGATARLSPEEEWSETAR